MGVHDLQVAVLTINVGRVFNGICPMARTLIRSVEKTNGVGVSSKLRFSHAAAQHRLALPSKVLKEEGAEKSTSSLIKKVQERAGLSQGTLNRPGTVRVGKVHTLEKSLIVKTFGRVNNQTLDRIRVSLSKLMAAKP